MLEFILISAFPLNIPVVARVHSEVRNFLSLVHLQSHFLILLFLKSDYFNLYSLISRVNLKFFIFHGGEIVLISGIDLSKSGYLKGINF